MTSAASPAPPRTLVELKNWAACYRRRLGGEWVITADQFGGGAGITLYRVIAVWRPTLKRDKQRTMYPRLEARMESPELALQIVWRGLIDIKKRGGPR